MMVQVLPRRSGTTAYRRHRSVHVGFLPRGVVVTAKHEHEVVAGAGEGLLDAAERSVSVYRYQICREIRGRRG